MNTKAGSELISKERQRQRDQEGWSAEHDATHSDRSLVTVAECYISAAVCGYTNGVPSRWPESWDPRWWKPSTSSIRNLVKAGALLAAEIDRLNYIRRLEENS